MSAELTDARSWWGVRSGLTGRVWVFGSRDRAEMELLRAPSGSILVRRTALQLTDEGPF